VVEHSIGNGEVDSSILSGSTIPSLEKPFEINKNRGFSSAIGFSHISRFGLNRP
jgi:hypothetical protein